MGMLRRYHYNVNADRLETHVEKGYGEGLLITAVASSKGLWAVIMDASAKHKGQVRLSWVHLSRAAQASFLQFGTFGTFILPRAAMASHYPIAIG